MIGDIIGNRKKKMGKLSTVLILLVSIVCFILTGLWEVLCSSTVSMDGM